LEHSSCQHGLFSFLVCVGKRTEPAIFESVRAAGFMGLVAYLAGSCSGKADLASSTMMEICPVFRNRPLFARAYTAFRAFVIILLLGIFL
jgi:hypothetical protein